MNKKQLIAIGVSPACIPVAIAAVQHAARVKDKPKPKQVLPEVVSHPENYLDDEHYGELAHALIEDASTVHEIKEPAPWKQFGEDIDDNSKKQMADACRVPSAVAGALMPDAHLGYGLPIGGVLACEGAVVPYAVGVDIACRMRLTLTDLPVQPLKKNDAKDNESLDKALEKGTLFGTGKVFKKPNEHDVMDEDWTVSAVTRENRDKAWKQLGSSGSGNHFVEWGIVNLDDANDFNVEAGEYVALLSHSGSRGTGASVCQRYTDIARKKLPQRYKDDPQLKHLAWLDLNEQEGQEYWDAMNLMGRYAAANHKVIHDNVTKLAGAEALAVVENHHNFAWKEVHNGHEVVVHRKGATPAGKGALGVIPASMAAPAYIVRGRGNAESLHSASHGAGRKMSRTAAKKKFIWAPWKDYLKHRNVRLLAGGLDEVPGAYKDIGEVMNAQTDLVEVLGSFHPRIVMMCGDGSRAED
jgi:tRNA-splicing ligase RtcB